MYIGATTSNTRCSVIRIAGDAINNGLLGEQVIPLNDAAALLTRPDGRKPSKVTTWRWATKGITSSAGGVRRRARLATIKIGNVRYTTVEAIGRFAAELDPRSMTDAPAPARRPAQRRAESAAAAAEMRKLGFM